MKTQDLIFLKNIPTQLPVNKIFKNRFSPRFFSQDPIPDKDLETIMEAARFTPSSYNLQPWFFYIAKIQTKGHKKLSSLFVPANKWAALAPVIILGCYEKKSIFGDNIYGQYDLGQAVATLVYQAQFLGYYSHQMAGFDHKKATTLVKENQVPWVMIALGKIGNYEKAPEEIVKMDNKPRERKGKIFEILT